MIPLAPSREPGKRPDRPGRNLGAAFSPLAGLLTIAAGAAILGLGQSPDETTAEAGDQASLLRVIVSGNSAGQLRVCRCSLGEHGGWDRLATVLKEKRSEGPVILLDAGAFLRPQGLHPEKAALATLRILGKLQYDAVNIAEHEMGVGWEVVSHEAKAAGVPALSANLLDSDSNPLFPPVLIKTIPADSFKPALTRDLRLGILALTSGSCDLRKYPRVDNSALSVQDPGETADRYLPDLRSEVDFLLVLCDLKREEIDALVAQHPEIDAVACGRRHQPDELRGTSRQAGGALVFYGGKDLFQHYGLMEFSLDPEGTVLTAGASCTLLEKGRVDQDKETMSLISELINAQAADARAEILSQATTSPLKPYSGVAVCKTCHAAEFRQWETTDHARAFQTLTQAEQLQPDCVSCHTTGYGAGGFVAKRSTPKLAGVQCEVCHGPAGKHARDPSDAFTFPDPMESCADCHTERRSPKFEPEAYRSSILHTPSSGLL